MFPFQPRDELVFGAPNNISPADHHQILQDLIFQDHAASLESDRSSNIINFNQFPVPTTRFGFRPMKRETRDDVIDSSSCGNNNNSRKRVMHRDIERRRRQQLSNLHHSLRSLLPVEPVKGKWSVCDQMLQAVNYITHKQKSIEELRIRRDELKKISNKLSTGKDVSISSNININGSQDLANCVTVNQLIGDGLEILITTSSELMLSRVMAQLLERELDVVSCVSTKAKGSFLHKIHAQARNVTSLDLPMLREELTNAVN